MKRRTLLSLVAVLLGAPQLLRAQATGRVHRVGFIVGSENDDSRRFEQAFREAMGQRGYRDGQNFVLAVRHYGTDRARIPGLADELMQWQADVLVANVSSTAAALKKKTSTVPIVMVTAVDAVGEGLVASLARPGGNITGMTSPGSAMHAKLVELARELLPKAKRIALASNPNHSRSATSVEAAMQAAQKLSLEAARVDVRGESDLQGLAERLSATRADALVIATDAVLFRLRDPIVQAALKARLPSVALLPEFIGSGAVAALGFDLVDNYRAAARFVDQILKGAKPAELPVEQPTQMQLTLSLKSAKALGLSVPPTLLVRADRVIE